MKSILKSVIAVFMASLSLNANAYDAKINGVYYNLNASNQTATVTNRTVKPDEAYTGDVVIPSTIERDGVVYTVTGIEKNAFKKNVEMTSINLPNSITTIGEWAFCDCSGLNSIVIPNSVASIGKAAFSGCGFTEITIPDHVTSIGEYWFQNCTNVTTLSIPDHVTTIEEGAFGNCTNLSSINIPTSVNSIGDAAFVNCGLKALNIPNSVQTIGTQAFRGCKSLSAVMVPGSVKSIGNMAFSGCSALTSITFSEGIEEICDAAFEHCTTLTRVVLPSSLKQLGEGAFKYCGNLREVYCYASSVPNVGDDIFQDTPYASGTLYVPEALALEYDGTIPWKDFKEIKCVPKLIYMVDGELYKEFEPVIGSSIVPEQNPKREGYSFSGWSEFPKTMPAEDLTVTGTFTFVDDIEEVVVDDGIYQIYSPDGKPVDTLQKGVNIIRKQNGIVKKVVIK